jgi:hypothetical protein
MASLTRTARDVGPTGQVTVCFGSAHKHVVGGASVRPDRHGKIGTPATLVRLSLRLSLQRVKYRDMLWMYNLWTKPPSS